MHGSPQPHFSGSSRSEPELADGDRRGLADRLKARGGGWLWGIVAVLAIEAVGLVGYGGWSAWARQSDGDMAARAAEYALFRQGIYPNAWLERPPSPESARYTVYPPYAFPLFAFFFEPGGVPQGRFLIESLSIASLGLMGLFAFHTLIPYGRPVAWVGALSGAAIAGNGTALAVGQFSILCVGLIVQQIIYLERGRSLAAGVCWALAMIKPQIALPFLLLFPMLRQTSGGLCGAIVLVALTGAACAWTGVAPSALFDHWARGMSLRFIEDGGGIGPGSLARGIGVDHRTVQVAAVALLAALFVPALVYLRRLGCAAVLPVAALCSVCGMLCFYHRHYDHIMLFPLVLTSLRSAAATQKSLPVAAALLTVVSLAIPTRFIAGFPGHAGVQAALWVAATALALRMATFPFASRLDAERAPDA